MKNSLIKDLKMAARGVGIIHDLEPWIITLKITKMFFDALIPFWSAYFSSLLVDEIASACTPSRLILYTSLIIVADFVFAIIIKLLSAHISKKEFSFSKKYELFLGQKAMKFDYEKLETSSTHLLAQKIKAGEVLHNYGLLKISEKIPLLFYHIFQVIMSVSIVLSLFVSSAGGNGVLRFLSSSYFEIILICLVAAVTVFSMHSTKGFSLKVKSAMNGFVFLNRSFDYYQKQYIDGYKAGKDIRLYKQDELIENELKCLSDSAYEENKKRTGIDRRYACINQLIGQILNFTVYTYVVIKAFIGSITVGSVLKYVVGINQFISGASEISHVITIIRANNDWLCYFYEYIDLPSQMKSGALPAGDCVSEIEFKNVSFRYSGCETYLLKGNSGLYREMWEAQAKYYT